MKDKFKQHEVDNILKLLSEKKAEEAKQIKELEYRTKDQVVELAKQHGYNIADINQVLSEGKYTRLAQIKRDLKDNLERIPITATGIGIGYKLGEVVLGESASKTNAEIAMYALTITSLITAITWGIATKKPKSLERLISEVKLAPGRIVGAAIAIYTVANIF